MKILSMIASMMLNALAAYIAAWPMIEYGIEAWTLALCGALMFPLALIARFVLAAVLGVVIHGGVPKADK